jgi:hypothetical protein
MPIVSLSGFVPPLANCTPPPLASPDFGGNHKASIRLSGFFGGSLSAVLMALLRTCIQRN